MRAQVCICCVLWPEVENSRGWSGREVRGVHMMSSIRCWPPTHLRHGQPAAAPPTCQPILAYTIYVDLSPRDLRKTICFARFYSYTTKPKIWLGDNETGIFVFFFRSVCQNKQVNVPVDDGTQPSWEEQSRNLGYTLKQGSQNFFYKVFH